MIVAGMDGTTVVAPGGNVWIVPDPGRPLDTYTAEHHDPGKIWRTQPSVRKVVGFAARQIAQLPFHTFHRKSDGDRIRLHDSEAERILREPSRFITGYQLVESLIIDSMICDRYLAIYFDDELVRIPPHRWTVRSNWLGQVTKIVLLTPAGQPDLDITEAPIVVGWGWSENAAGGVSPLVTLAELLEENRRSVRWRKNQWDNSPQFGGILKHPGSFKTKEKREGFVTDWRNWMEGKSGTPLLEDGLDYQRAPTISPKDARDIEGRELTDVEVCGAFHIPPELVGVRPGNYSNMVAFRSMLFGPTLGPKITEFTQALNQGLVPVVETRPNIYIEAAREAAINGSLIEQVQVLQTAIGGPFMLRSEGRSRLNLPFVEGTDELIVPLNVLEGGQASATDSGAQNRKQLAAAPRRAVQKADTETDDPEADRLRSRLERDLVEALEEQADELAAGNVDLDAFVERWAPRNAAALLPGLKAAARLAAGRVLAEHPVDDWDDEVMDAYLDAMADTTGGKVAAGAVAAFEGEEDTDTARAALTGIATTWAAASAAEAMGFGGNDAAAAANLGTKTWIVTSGNPRPSHAAMDGETVGIDETFSNGAKWPGEAGLDVDEAAGCTCECEFSK